MKMLNRVGEKKKKKNSTQSTFFIILPPAPMTLLVNRMFSLPVYLYSVHTVHELKSKHTPSKFYKGHQRSLQTTALHNAVLLILTSWW